MASMQARLAGALATETDNAPSNELIAGGQGEVGWRWCSALAVRQRRWCS